MTTKTEVEMSRVPAKIVRDPFVCGGDPTLYGHRLSVNWYAGFRSQFDGDAEKTNAYIQQSWEYLRPEQIQCMSDFYDANPEWWYRK